MEISKQRLDELFCYDPGTGAITNRIRRSSSAGEGAVAGCVNSVNGYRDVMIRGRNYKAHRLCLVMSGFDIPEGKQVDHINGIRADNRLDNLRVVSCQDNRKNQATPKDNTSGTMGVYWNKRANKWMAAISVSGKQKHLGYYSDKHDAIYSRYYAGKDYGFHENHGRQAEAS